MIKYTEDKEDIAHYKSVMLTINGQLKPEERQPDSTPLPASFKFKLNWDQVEEPFPFNLEVSSSSSSSSSGEEEDEETKKDAAPNCMNPSTFAATTSTTTINGGSAIKQPFSHPGGSAMKRMPLANVKNSSQVHVSYDADFPESSPSKAITSTRLLPISRHSRVKRIPLHPQLHQQRQESTSSSSSQQPLSQILHQTCVKRVRSSTTITTTSTTIPSAYDVGNKALFGTPPKTQFQLQVASSSSRQQKKPSMHGNSIGRLEQAFRSSHAKQQALLADLTHYRSIAEMEQNRPRLVLKVLRNAPSSSLMECTLLLHTEKEPDLAGLNGSPLPTSFVCWIPMTITSSEDRNSASVNNLLQSLGHVMLPETIACNESLNVFRPYRFVNNVLICSGLVTKATM